MKVTAEQLRSLVLGMMVEVRKKGSKSGVQKKKDREAARGPNGSPSGFARDPMHDFSNPLGDENYLKRDGASAWGPLTGYRDEPDVRVIDNVDRLPPDELKEAFVTSDQLKKNKGKDDAGKKDKEPSAPPAGAPGAPKAPKKPEKDDEEKGGEEQKLAPEFEKLIASCAKKLKGMDDEDAIKDVLRQLSRDTEAAEGEDPAELESPVPLGPELEQTLPVYENVGPWGSLHRALVESRIRSGGRR